MTYRPDASRVTTDRASRPGHSRFSALLALVALVVGMFVTTESPALAVAYTYTFNNGGGGNTPFGGSQEEGTTINWGASCKGPGTSRPGYTLLGFRSSHDGLVYGTDCGGGYFSLTGYTMPSQNVIFTFVWSLDITYDSQGGSAIADGDTTTTNGATITTLPTDPTRAGYTFAGWYTASSGGTQITTSAPHGQISDFTLYAQWTQVPVQVVVPAPPAPAPSSFTIDMGGAVSTVEHRPEEITTNMNATAGTLFSVTGTQFQANSDIEVWINSTRVLLGTATVGADNTFILTSNLPDDIEPGEHTLEIVGVNLAGDAQTTWIGLLVDEPELIETPNFELPSTGHNSDIVLNWSLAILVAGILVGALSRRRGVHR